MLLGRSLELMSDHRTSKVFWSKISKDQEFKIS